MITPTKSLWHCLGACQVVGTAIDWVMKAEGVLFRHAVELLQNDYSPLVADARALQETTAPPAIQAVRGCTMKYSDSQDYMGYAQSKAKGDIASAKLSLAACLILPEFKNKPPQYADLLQRMGELCFLDGERKRALKYYEESEIADPDSLLVKYYRAEFLAMRIGDKQAAAAISDQIVSIARNHAFAESEDDFGSDAHIEKAARLKSSLLS